MDLKSNLSMVAIAFLVACSAPEESNEDEDPIVRDFQADLFTMEQGNYRAVKEGLRVGSYLLMAETEEAAGFELKAFAFRKSGDTLQVYAIPEDSNDCLEKMYSGKLESNGKDAYILSPVDGFGYALAIKSIPVPDLALYEIEFRANHTASDSALAVYSYFRSESISKTCNP